MDDKQPLKDRLKRNMDQKQPLKDRLKRKPVTNSYDNVSSFFVQSGLSLDSPANYWDVSQLWFELPLTNNIGFTTNSFKQAKSDNVMINRAADDCKLGTVITPKSGFY
ncbi:hypothetical protein Bca4012_089493 [Brassica carinata]